MNTVIETILDRRSVIQFAARQISDADLGILLDCALSISSGRSLRTGWFR